MHANMQTSQSPIVHLPRLPSPRCPGPVHLYSGQSRHASAPNFWHAFIRVVGTHSANHLSCCDKISLKLCSKDFSATVLLRLRASPREIDHWSALIKRTALEQLDSIVGLGHWSINIQDSKKSKM